MKKQFTEEDIASRWDAGAGVWVEAVRSGKDLYREALNNPALFAMLGNVRGKRVLDLGCGEGYNTRVLAGEGAKVMGIDLSKELVNLAIEREEEEKLGIVYHVANAADLYMLDDSSFADVVSFMAIQDMRDIGRVFHEVARVLKPTGRFLFSIPHPCFERRSKREGWQEDEEGHPVYFKVDRYFDEGPYEYEFTMKSAGMRMPKRIVSFHRTLTTYFRTVTRAGLVLKGIVEPVLSKKMATKHPRLKEHLRVPQSFHIEAVKQYGMALERGTDGH